MHPYIVIMPTAFVTIAQIIRILHEDIRDQLKHLQYIYCTCDFFLELKNAHAYKCCTGADNASAFTLSDCLAARA